jgi:hypothetical protein
MLYDLATHKLSKRMSLITPHYKLVEKYHDIVITKFKEGTMIHFTSDCE